MELYDFFLSETLSDPIPSASYVFDEKGLTLPFVFMLKYCEKNSLFAIFLEKYPEFKVHKIKITKKPT